MILNFFFLGWVLYRKLHGYSIGYIITGLGKIFCSTLVMSAGLWWLKTWMSPYLQGSIALQLPLVLLLIVMGAFLYGVTLHSLKLPELELITDKIRQRFK